MSDPIFEQMKDEWTKAETITPANHPRWGDRVIIANRDGWEVRLVTKDFRIEDFDLGVTRVYRRRTRPKNMDAIEAAMPDVFEGTGYTLEEVADALARRLDDHGYEVQEKRV